MRSPETGRTTTAVQRVRGQQGIADGNNADGQRPAVDDVVTPPADEPGDLVHAGDGLGAAVEIRRSERQRLSRPVEDLVVVQQSAHHAVIGRGRKREREGAVVTGEDAVLQVAQIAADRTCARRQIPAGPQSVEPREVDDAALVRHLGNLTGTDLGKPYGKRAAATGCDDGEVETLLGSACEPHAADNDGRIRPERSRIGHEPDDLNPAAYFDATLGCCDTPQNPLEGGPPTRQHRKVLVAWFGHIVRDGGREAIGETQVGRACGIERLQHIGIVVTQKVADAGQEGMAMTDLRRTTPIGLERLMGISRNLERVPLEQHDVMPVAGQRDTSRQTRDSRSDNRHTDHGKAT